MLRCWVETVVQLGSPMVQKGKKNYLYNFFGKLLAAASERCLEHSEVAGYLIMFLFIHVSHVQCMFST